MTAESDRRAGLFARLSTLAEEHRELEARLADPETLADPAELQRVGKRYHEMNVEH